MLTLGELLAVPKHRQKLRDKSCLPAMEDFVGGSMCIVHMSLKNTGEERGRQSERSAISCPDVKPEAEREALSTVMMLWDHSVLICLKQAHQT